MSEGPSKRRRLRFSLRHLFIATAMVAMLASLLPAHRAATVHPVEALREE